MKKGREEMMTHRESSAAPSPGLTEKAAGHEGNLGLSVDCLTLEEEVRPLK